MKSIRTGLAAVMLAAAASPLYAQQSADNASAFGERASVKIGERFKRADVDGDGKLSREEAKTSMPRVYENFNRIDTGNTGYVTLDQITQFSQKLIAERRSQRGS